MLAYPHDRYNGFVHLTDGHGQSFVPDFTRSYDRGSNEGNTMAYAGAFMVLAKRLSESKGDQCGSIACANK